MDDNVYNHIANETYARALWNQIESLYASKSGNNKLYLLNMLMNLRYKEGSQVLDHLNEFQGVLDQLSSMRIKFEDEVQGLWLLNTLPDSWETFRISLTNSAPNGKVSMQLVKGGILNEEMRRKTQNFSSHSEMLVTKTRGRNQNRSQKDRGKSRSKSKSRYKNVECYYYHKMGHVKKYCFLWKKENKGKQEKKDDGGNDPVSSVSDDLLTVDIVDYEYKVNLVSDDEFSWVIDSGASIHVTPKKEFFTSYTPGNFGVLKMSNDDLAKVISVRDVCLKTNM